MPLKSEERKKKRLVPFSVPVASIIGAIFSKFFINHTNISRNINILLENISFFMEGKSYFEIHTSLDISSEN